MFSLQRMMGNDDEFCALLEASANEGCQSVAALKRGLAERDRAVALENFAAARRKDKQITNQIAELLLHALVVAMEREDIESLADSLYRIPKTVEKFAERHSLSSAQLQAVDFSRQIDLMERAVNLVLLMVKALRSGAPLAEIKQINANIQKTESDADDVMLELIAELYRPGYPALLAVIVKDLFELNEKVVDRCRDVGNVLTRVVLKNS